MRDFSFFLGAKSAAACLFPTRSRRFDHNRRCFGRTNVTYRNPPLPPSPEIKSTQELLMKKKSSPATLQEFRKLYEALVDEVRKAHGCRSYCCTGNEATRAKKTKKEHTRTHTSTK